MTTTRDEKTSESAPAPAAARKLYMEDFGCQMNKNDAELVVGRMKAAGFERTEDIEDANVILYYGCAIREQAEERVFGRLGALKPLKRRRPDTVIGVMGCMAQNQKERIFERAPHVDLVVGTSRFEEIADFVAEVEHRDRVTALEDGEVAFRRDLDVRPQGFQAYVTIMRGCNKFCTFCIVPFTQGRERSRPPEDIEDEVRRLVDDGVVQVTLLGQRVNTYGLDLNRGETLATLLSRLERIPGLRRLQFITSHPTHIDADLMRVIRDHEVHSRYLHLPVQSGSDEVLKKMNRGYTADSYRRTIDMVKTIVPDMSLATDWIVGFPNETDEDFERSARLLRDVAFQTSFVFRYSERAGTNASKRIPDTIPEEVKLHRNHVLLDEQARISERLHSARIGEVHEILVEGLSKRDASRWFGRTSQNWIVVFTSPRDFTGRFVKVRITSNTALTLFGELV
ncbi:MAG: tRNA (N6-isopentenyl adenosine(37)-C2)-methylthiotransferase MiaB [Planctomycetota bacterium]